MLSRVQAKQRIQQLVNNDNSTDKQSNAYYNECMLWISAHLYTFYQQYAQHNNLSVQQTQQVSNNWDKQEWIKAIKSIDMQDWPREAKQRVRAYGTAAGISHGHMISNIIKVGLVVYAVKQIHMIHTRTNQDLEDQVKFMKHHMTDGNDIKGISHVTEQARKDLWSKNLWTDMDGLANDTENLVNQHLRHGMSLYDLHSILEHHANPKQFRPNQSIADRVSQMEFNARRIVRTESARLVNKVNVATYRQVGVTLVAWLTEANACEKCTALSDGSPYKLDSAPQPPDDGHPQCRCWLQPIGTRFQRFVTIPRVF